MIVLIILWLDSNHGINTAPQLFVTLNANSSNTSKAKAIVLRVRDIFPMCKKKGAMHTPYPCLYRTRRTKK